MLHGFINRNQSGSVKALPHVRFSMMNTTNASTGFSPFQLRLGHLPGLIPLFVTANLETPHSDIEALMLLDVRHNLILQAQDNLLHSKVTQAWDEDGDKTKTETKMETRRRHRRRWRQDEDEDRDGDGDEDEDGDGDKMQTKTMKTKTKMETR